MKQLKILFIVLIILLFIPAILLADTIYLNDGTVIKGKIIEITDDTVTIETDFGILKIFKDKIEKIEFDYTPPKEEEKDEYSELREKIKEALKDLVTEDKIIVIVIKEEIVSNNDKKAEEERLAKEEAERKAEEERLAKEEAERKAEEERLAKEEAERKAEEERLAKEEAEKEANKDIEVHNEADEDENTNYNWANDNGNGNGSEGDHLYVTTKKDVFSIGFFNASSLGFDWDSSLVILTGISFRFMDYNSWWGINIDLGVGVGYDIGFLLEAGFSVRLPKAAFSPYANVGLRYMYNILGYYDYYSPHSFALTLSAGFEWFFSKYVSLSSYVKIPFDFDFYFGSAFEELLIGFGIYINF